MLIDVVKATGDIPISRFGHTICLVNKGTAVLFGGAVGDTGKYQITGDTYTLDMKKKFWKKLNPTGSVPGNRAAHQSVCLELDQMIIFGGAVGGKAITPPSPRARPFAS